MTHIGEHHCFCKYSTNCSWSTNQSIANICCKEQIHLLNKILQKVADDILICQVSTSSSVRMCEVLCVSMYLAKISLTKSLQVCTKQVIQPMHITIQNYQLTIKLQPSLHSRPTKWIQKTVFHTWKCAQIPTGLHAGSVDMYHTHSVQDTCLWSDFFCSTDLLSTFQTKKPSNQSSISWYTCLLCLEAYCLSSMSLSVWAVDTGIV